jgi:hypothetical protein
MGLVGLTQYNTTNYRATKLDRMKYSEWLKIKFFAIGKLDEV